MFKNFLKIDPEINLNSVAIFKCTWVSFLVTSILCIFIIVFNSNLELDLSYNGFNYALFTVYKVPLSMMAACFTILGSIAIIHRSSQTALQIKKTRYQDIISNFYKHRDDYTAHFNELKGDFHYCINNNISGKSIRKYYMDTFPMNTPTNFNIKARLDWVICFDESLIKLTYILLEMQKTTDIYILLELFCYFNSSEEGMSKNLFGLGEVSKLGFIEVSESPKILTIIESNVNRPPILVYHSLIATCFSRVVGYAGLLTTIKSLAGDFQELKLYSIDVYKKMMEYYCEGSLDNEGVNLYCISENSIYILDEEKIKLSEVVNKIKTKIKKQLDQLDIT